MLRKYWKIKKIQGNDELGGVTINCVQVILRTYH